MALDIDRAHDIYHDDVTVEYPQSGGRISGIHNLYGLRAHYPAKLSPRILRVRGMNGSGEYKDQSKASCVIFPRIVSLSMSELQTS